MHGVMYRVASIRFTYSSVARHRMRIVLSCCDVIILKNLVWRSCNKVIAVGTPAIRHIQVKLQDENLTYWTSLISLKWLCWHLQTASN